MEIRPQRAESHKSSDIGVAYRAEILHWRTIGEDGTIAFMDEGRKRVLAIVAVNLVARHLKTADDLFDSKPSPRTESMVAAAVQWAERIMLKIDNVCGS